MEGRREWPAQALAILTGVRQAGADSFPENLPFELRKNGHGSTGRRGQIQCLRQRHEADAEMLQFREGRPQVGD